MSHYALSTTLICRKGDDLNQWKAVKVEGIQNVDWLSDQRTTFETNTMR